MSTSEPIILIETSEVLRPVVNNSIVQEAKNINQTSSKLHWIAALALAAGITLGFGIYHYYKNKGKKPKTATQTLEYLNLYNKIKQGYHIAPLVFLKSQNIRRIYGTSLPLDIGEFKNLYYKPVVDKQDKNPFIQPIENGIHLTDLGQNHRLLYNKFATMKYHMLITTKQFQPQTSMLTEQDFKQTLLVMKSLNGVYFYNSGTQSGGSQPHKHLQCLSSNGKQNVILELIINFAKNQYHQRSLTQEISQFPKFSFVHGMILLKEELSLDELAVETHRAYLKLYQEYVPGEHPGSKISYNLIGTEDFLMMIPRRQNETFGLASLNSIAFTGSIMTKDNEKYQKLVKYSPEKILGDVTFADMDQLNSYRKQVKN